MPIEVDILSVDEDRRRDADMRLLAWERRGGSDGVSSPPVAPTPITLVEPYHGGPYVLPVMFREAFFEFDGSARLSSRMERSESVGGFHYAPEPGLLMVREEYARVVMMQRCRLVYDMTPAEAGVATRSFMDRIKMFVAEYERMCRSVGRSASRRPHVRVRW